MKSKAEISLSSSKFMALVRAEIDIETYEIHSEVISRIIHRYKEILLDRNTTICNMRAEEYFQIRT